MARPHAVTRQECEREIRLKLEEDARHGQIKREGRAFAEEVRETWVRIWEGKGPHPYETGDYADSIEVHGVGRATSLGRDERGRFTGKNIYGHYRVSTKNKHAGFIEYGTGSDTKGVGVWQDLDGKWHKSPLTPTPEFAPAAATAAFFHGTGPD